ncbi:protein NUCLEAR FUSION DEFECTIVE 6, chloroplastic/mitochondrial [Cucurbita moschata]|uniref:Protein NUCLEAR FUSION DEFECTIVE 6, chloroplastic/mitochondrial n=2 Tax=Cucurbita TaxID=3660 RepID=A0A6J1HCT7_CUCMO
MAACSTWKTLRISSSSARTLLQRSSSSPPSASHLVSKPTMSAPLPSAKPSASSRFSVPKLTNFRLPVELSSVQSLMPLHSATASALFTSLLSLHNNSWGCLSEGFATPL